MRFTMKSTFSVEVNLLVRTVSLEVLSSSMLHRLTKTGMASD